MLDPDAMSLDLVLAALPVALLVFWMTKKRSLPSNRALPLAALVLYAILLGYFAVRPVLVHAAVVEGLLTALTPILIVWGAILLFKTMEHSGAMGNMVCIHNIVAVCSILGLHHEEGRILRQTFRPLLLYGAIAGALSLIL